MKIRTVFYSLFALNLLQLLFTVLMPFGGIWVIKNMIDNGIFSHSIIKPESLFTLNRIVAVIYWVSIILTLLFPIIKFWNKKISYKVGIFLGSMSVLILFAGLLLKHFGV